MSHTPGFPGGAQGTPGLVFRGAWSDSFSYSASDSVTFGGCAYVYLPTNAEYRQGARTRTLRKRGRYWRNPGATGPTEA